MAELFQDWIEKNYPDRAEKVLNHIRSVHGGKLEDYRHGTRMRGEGTIAQSFRTLFKVSKEKYFKGRSMPPYNLDAFQPLSRGGQMNLF